MVLQIVLSKSKQKIFFIIIYILGYLLLHKTFNADIHYYHLQIFRNLHIINLIIIIAILDSTRVFRLTRAVSLNVVVMDFVEAARLRGEGLAWIMRREILPNILPPLIAEFGLRFCFVFLTIAALSFLGVGIQPPTADWGSMVRENASLIQFAQYDIKAGLTPLLPAAAIALLTVAVNFVVDWFLHKTSGIKDEQ